MKEKPRKLPTVMSRRYHEEVVGSLEHQIAELNIFQKRCEAEWESHSEAECRMINEYRADLESRTAELNLCKDGISGLNQQIAALEQRIANYQREIKRKDKALRRRRRQVRGLRNVMWMRIGRWVRGVERRCYKWLGGK